MITDVLIGLIAFSLFVLFQGLMINGINACFKGGSVNDMNKGRIYQGMIFFMMAPKFFEKSKDKWWAKPLYSCVKCMSSLWGGGSFFAFVFWIYGFEWWEIPLGAADMFILVYVNFYLYQKG